MHTIFSALHAPKFTKQLVYRLFSFFLSGAILFSNASLFQSVQAETAEWILQGRGPGGTSVLAMAADPETPSTLYAGTNFGIYKSTDSGDTWTNTTNSLLTYYGDIPTVNTIAIHPLSQNILYIGSSSGGGVFKSTNAGQTWTTINNGITTRHVQTVVIDPQNPEILYAGTLGVDSQGGIFKSSNGGQDWSAVNTGLPLPAHVYSIVIDPQNTNNVYAGLSGNGIYKSTNGGETWTALNTSPSIKSNRVLAIDWDTAAIYAGTSDLGLFKSTDGGVTFTKLNEGINNKLSIVTIWLATSTTLYLGTEDGGIYASSNAGETWAARNSGLSSFYIQAFTGVENDPSVFYAGTSGGVFRTPDDGAGWEEHNNGLPAAKTEALLLLPQEPYTLFAGTSGGGVYHLQDRTWIPRSSGISNTWIRSLVQDPKTPTTLYAGTFFGGVFKSIDSGAAWTEINTGLPPNTGRDIREIIVHPVDSATLYIGLQNGVYKSLDGGDHWTASNDGLPYNSRDISALALDGNNPDIIYAGTVGGGVYKTTNAGETWQASSAGLTSLYVMELAVDPVQSSIVYAGVEGNLFRSTDGGATWDITDLNNTATSFMFDPSRPEILFAGTEGWGVYMSIDNGLTWESMTTNGFTGGRAYVYDLALDPHSQLLYAATQTGTDQLSQARTTGIGESLQSAYAELTKGIFAKSIDASVLTYGVFALCVSEECLATTSTSVFIPMLTRDSVSQ